MASKITLATMGAPCQPVLGQSNLKLEFLNLCLNNNLSWITCPVPRSSALCALLDEATHGKTRARKIAHFDLTVLT